MNEKNVSPQIQILLNQFNAKNFEVVISKGKVLIKKNPEYVILYNLIGSAYQSVGEYLKAKNYFDGNVKVNLIPSLRAVDIDDKDDLNYAKYLFKTKNKKR